LEGFLGLNLHQLKSQIASEKLQHLLNAKTWRNQKPLYFRLMAG
jgi:hypothetical protein